MAKHNKKRNVGLLHEQLVRHASQMTVEGKKSKADQAINILIESFAEGTELLREFKLFSALVHPRVSDDNIARRIVEESKKACGNHDPHKLNKEKSALIRRINHEIDRPDFYSQRVENYRVFSTVQALLNEWRGKNSLSADERVKYEIVLENHLVREEKVHNLTKAENADPLVFNIMLEKFNKKYGDVFDTRQTDLLNHRLVGNDTEVIRHSNLIKLEAKASVENFYKDCDNAVLNEKKNFLLEKIEGYDPDNSDMSVSKALMLVDLIKEMEE